MQNTPKALPVETTHYALIRPKTILINNQYEITTFPFKLAGP